MTLPTSSSTGDNLGNHTATTTLNLNGNKLVDGATVRSGLNLSATGLLTLGAPSFSADSTAGQGVRLPDPDQAFILASKPNRVLPPVYHRHHHYQPGHARRGIP